MTNRIAKLENDGLENMGLDSVGMQEWAAETFVQYWNKLQ